jgi:uncharacterized protein YbjQ (UPF0145 family)
MQMNSDVILTNLETVPGKRTDSILGMVYGHVRVTTDPGGEPYVKGSMGKWPWADTSMHVESLYREAEHRLRSAAVRLGADAVLKVKANLSVDKDGFPAITMMGTAVAFSGKGIEEAFSLKKRASREEVAEDPYSPVNGEVAITFGGSPSEWKPVTARPSSKEKGYSRERGRTVDGKEHDAEIQVLSDLLDISLERAKQLVKAGLGNIEEIASSDRERLASIPGMNPTQARLILDKAKSLTGQD